MICALLLGTLSLSSAQSPAYDLLKNNRKQGRFGGPSMIQQVEYVQQAVDMLQGIIEQSSANQGSGMPTPSAHKQFISKTGDHVNQFMKGKYGDFVGCQVCWYAVDEANQLLSNQLIRSSVEDSLMVACSAFLNWGTCAGFLNNFADLVVNNLLALNLQNDYMCTVALDLCPTWNSNYNLVDENQYVNNMLASKPLSIQNDDFIDNLYKEIAADPNKEARPTMKFVHFTDIHMDLLYRAGASRVCGDIICCREANGYPTNASLQAGPLGTFGCDIPIDVVTLMGDIINTEIKPDVVFWGGDVTPHDMNSYSYEYVTNLQNRLDQWFAANLSSYVLYPLEGNHDFVEPSSQDFTKQDPMIAYNLKLWDRYFDEEAKTVYAKHGYYSQSLKVKNATTGEQTVVKGVNVVVVNTEACYNVNFYLLSQRNDPGDVLAWLNATLADYEQRGEIAVLMAHHPPGDADCLYQWAYRYRAILDRYQHIVRWSMYGHVHLEIMGVAHSVKNKKPTGVHFWSGSVSSWFEVNPSFKVFEVDTKTMLPIKSHTYVLDITNTEPSKQGWKYHHEVTALYNMTDLSPSSFVKLAERIRDDEQVALLYQRTQSNGGLQTYFESCDQACRLNIYCTTINTVYFESKDCMGLPRIDIRNDPISTLMELLSDPWVQHK